MTRFLDIFCRVTEWVAAILLVGVTALVVVSTLGRYLFATPVPDSFDISRLVLGACLAWGFAVIGLKGGHIQVDLVAESVGPRLRRAIDALAWAALLVLAVLLTWKIWGRILSAQGSGETTFDLRLPLWPFLALIWGGLAASCVTIAIKLIRIIAGVDMVASADNQELDEAKRGLR
ncbi:TRAP transporter small permease [Pararhodobacter marinus]|uniref:TRAP transporter small permease protein n=1 Tax=Pararhodobacter marinus TaxID=2184063 RepID=A0A2U2CD33_9RHOB|nr:TRAP transporter small permease [Pararhodobacter marinus]PWE29808.1 TRAP transporter small permease [Pararhodobacter marinus]